MKNSKIRTALLTKTGKLRAAVTETRVIDALKGEKIYLYHHTGKGRFSSYSARSALPEILDSLEIRYKIGNDAPRGGLLGEFLQSDPKKQPKTKKAIIDFILAEK